MTLFDIMKAKVSTLYRNGKRLPINKVCKTVVGDLNLSVSKHPVTCLACCTAVVLTDGGISLVPDMVDAQCVVIAAHGLRLRGVEMVMGRELAQEWWCVPMSNAESEVSE